MNVQINPQWNANDVMLALVTIAQRIGTDAKLFMYDTGMEYKQQVTIGLSEDMHCGVYHTNKNMDVYIQYPNGAAVIYLESAPGQMTIEGSTTFCATVSHILSAFDPGTASRQPVAFFHCPRLKEMPVGSLLRMLYREAGRMRASMWLSDEAHNAKLVRITSSWMLDVYEKPVDVEFRFPDRGSIVLHLPNCGVYANQQAFSEAGKLLENIEHR